MKQKSYEDWQLTRRKIKSYRINSIEEQHLIKDNLVKVTDNNRKEKEKEQKRKKINRKQEVKNRDEYGNSKLAQ